MEVDINEAIDAISYLTKFMEQIDQFIDVRKCRETATLCRYAIEHICGMYCNIVQGQTYSDKYNTMIYSHEWVELSSCPAMFDMALPQASTPENKVDKVFYEPVGDWTYLKLALVSNEVYQKRLNTKISSKIGEKYIDEVYLAIKEMLKKDL